MSPPKREIPEDEPPAGAPEYIVTFADMTTLLVTFFILMLTFSTPREEKLALVKGSLLGALGITDLPNKPSVPLLQDRRELIAHQAQEGLFMPPEEVMESTAEDAQRLVREIDDPMLIEVEKIKDGLILRLAGDVLFEAGRAALRPERTGVLGDIADLLNTKPLEAIIEGHTDSGFRPSPRYPTPDSIGAARAAAVADFFITRGRVDPSKLGISSFGARRPRADNSTATGRGKNRRVEILIRVDSWRQHR